MKSSPGIMTGTSQRFAASWPGLSRPSTSYLSPRKTWMPGTRPGMTDMNAPRSSPDRLMHGDEFGAVRKRRFHLDVVDHFGNAIHHLRAGDHLRAGLHQFSDGAAVARALDDEVGDDGDRLGMVELDAALQSAARHHGGH